MLRFATVSAMALATALPAMAQEINLYSGRHYDTDLVIFDRFTEETGIKVNILDGSGDELQARIEAEGANSPADLFWTVDGGRLHRAVEAGIFQPVESDILNDRIPADLRHPDGLFYSLTSRARVIFYNADAGMPEGVTTYEDLARDDLGLSVCIRSSSNIYNVSLMAEMVHVHGEDDAQAWAEGLKANLARDPQGGDTDQIRALAAGECDLAVANTYYWGRLQTSGNPADREVAAKTLPIFPNQDGRGTHVNVSGIGVVANAPNEENAVKFIEYLTSPFVQSILADSNNEYPVVEDTVISGPMRDWADFKRSDTNIADYGTNQAAAIAVWDRAAFP